MNHIKQKIRNKILAKRAELTEAFIGPASRKIHQKLYKTKEYNDAKIIMFYVSKEKEVETWSVIKKSIKAGQKICVPKTDRIKYKLYPIMIKIPERDLRAGHFGIHEPVLKKKNVVSTKIIDLIITPGVAFDKKGNRLGWGKGYYDKFLKGAGAVPKIGLAFDFQIVRKIPTDARDIPVDMVITEKRTIHNL